MKDNGLLKFIKRLLVLLAIVFVCDRAIGMLLENLFYKQTHGDDVVSIELLEKTKADILIFGSSRASHHYNSAILSEKTGLSCYNGGRDEMTITYIDAVLPIVLKRYTPKVVIIDLTPSELANYPDKEIVYQRIATKLQPFAHRHPELKTTIAKAGKMEVWKSEVSHVYPYNSLIGSSIQNAYTKIGHHSIAGYEPLEGSIDTAYYKKPSMNFNHKTGLNADLVHTMQQIVSRLQHARQVRLILVISPFYFSQDFSGNQSYERIKAMAKEAGVELYDFSQAAPFLQNPSLFYDEVHLNDEGATLFSHQIAGIIHNRN